MRAAALCALAGLLAMAAAPAALAEVQAGALEGRWCFEAEPFVDFGVTQEISGQLDLEIAADAEGDYRCVLSAFDYVREEDLRIRAEQSCAAVYEDGVLVVRSQLVSVDPDWVSYLPDDFTLEVESADSMTGVMHTPNDTPVAFARCEALLS